MVKLLRGMSLDAAEGKGSLELEKSDQLLSRSLCRALLLIHYHPTMHFQLENENEKKESEKEKDESTSGN